MKVFKHFICAFLVICGGLFWMSAMPASEVSTSKKQVQIVPEDAMNMAKQTISELEAQPNLTKKEVKKLERLKKRVKKIEKMEAGGKSWIVALLLSIFLGALGIHRFYLGYIWQGVVQIITLGGFFGIWVLIDIIRIAIRDLQPIDGSYVD